MAHYQRGRYITAISEDKKMPILNKDDGQVLMPIFTDVQEFLKFQNENRDMKYTMGVVEAARIPEAMGPEEPVICVSSDDRFGRYDKSQITAVIWLFLIILSR